MFAKTATTVPAILAHTTLCVVWLRCFFLIKRWSWFLLSLNLSWPHDSLCSIKCSENDALALLSLALKRPWCFCSLPFGGHHVRKPELAAEEAAWRTKALKPQGTGRHVNEAVQGQPACQHSHWPQMWEWDHAQQKRTALAETCPNCQSTPI